MMEIGKYLRQTRELKGLKLRELSEVSGVSISHLSDIERGTTQPALDTLEKIVNSMGLDLRIEFVLHDSEFVSGGNFREMVTDVYEELGKVLRM